MNILYVYAHPNANSFNGVLKQQACTILAAAHHKVTISDLYASQFNAVASWLDFDSVEGELDPQYFAAQKIAYEQQALANDIQTEIEKILWADHIILQFPLWWFTSPAILKGWLDRVLIKGFAYDAGRVFATGLLQGKTTSLVVSTQSPASAYQVTGMHQHPIGDFLLSIHHTLRFVGMQTLTPFVTYDAFNIDATRQGDIIERYQTYLFNLHRSTTNPI